jgi:hypothetical protein
MTKPHKKLIAWRKSMDLVEQVYDVTGKFPQENLLSQFSDASRRDISPVQHRGRSC